MCSVFGDSGAPAAPAAPVPNWRLARACSLPATGRQRARRARALCGGARPPEVRARHPGPRPGGPGAAPATCRRGPARPIKLVAKWRRRRPAARLFALAAAPLLAARRRTTAGARHSSPVDWARQRPNGSRIHRPARLSEFFAPGSSMGPPPGRRTQAARPPPPGPNEKPHTRALI